MRWNPAVAGFGKLNEKGEMALAAPLFYSEKV
jgi:hypothetical protein